MMKRLCLPALIGLHVMATSLPAFAGPATLKGAPIGYEDTYRRVVDLEKSEEYENALKLLDTIPVSAQTVFSRLKRSSLLVRIGRFTEAESLLNALLNDPAAESIRPTVQGDLDDLRARMPKLTIRLADGTSSAWVTLDDKPVAPPATIAVNPGTHTVVAKKGNVECFRQHVTLQDSQTLEVEIDTSVAPPTGSVSAQTPPAPVPAPSLPSSKPTVVDRPAQSSNDRVLGYTFVAVGAAALGVSLWSSVRVHDLNRESSDLAAQGDAGAFDKTDSARSWQWVGRIALGVGVVGIGTGGYFLFRPSPRPTEASVRAVPTVGSSSWGLSLEGAW